MSSTSRHMQAWCSLQKEWIWPCVVTRTTCYICHTWLHIVLVDRPEEVPITVDHIHWPAISHRDSHLAQSFVIMQILTCIWTRKTTPWFGIPIDSNGVWWAGQRLSIQHGASAPNRGYKRSRRPCRHVVRGVRGVPDTSKVVGVYVWGGE